jgi:hypothetical protein
MSIASKGKTTTDHDEIRHWAEVRGGRPVEARGEGTGAADGLRLAFPETSSADAGLAPISWDEWFRRFDEHDLALLIEELTSDGRQSHFNKLVPR